MSRWYPGKPPDTASGIVYDLAGSSPAGSTTTTTNAAPWSVQQPYLEEGFQGASSLYGGAGPQYYPGQSYATPTDAQYQALQGTVDSVTGGAAGALTSMGNATLQNILGGDYLNSNPADPALNAIGTGSSSAPGMGTLNTLSSYNPALNNPAIGMYSPYTSGSLLNANNPYFQNVAQTTEASVTPQIEAQFTAGGDMNSPAAAFATSQGVSNAVGNLAEQNYMQEQQNQLTGIGQVGGLYSGGQSLQAGAAGTALGAENTALNTQSGNYNTALNQMTQALYDVPNQVNQNLGDLSAEYNAGSTAQGLSQSQINDAINRWNYGQTLPYQQLSSFMNSVGGNYGGTSSTTEPYFENSTANLLGTGLGVAGIGNALVGNGTSTGLISGLSTLFSDPELKDIDGLYTGALDTIEKLPISTARYKGEQDKRNRPMVMATDVEKVMPFAVGKAPAILDGEVGLYSVVNFNDFVPLILRGMQELNAKIDQKAA